MLVIIAVALIANLHTSHAILNTRDTNTDVIVLLKASKDIKVEAIKTLSHTDSLFKVKALSAPNETEWNYAVLGKSFQTVEEKDTYLSTIKNLPFIEKIEPRDNTGGSASELFFANAMIKVFKFFGNIFGTLPKRPLKPQTPPIVKCDTVEIADDQPMFSFSFMRTRDEKAMKEYGKVMMTKMFPALDARFVYLARSNSKRWPQLSIASYDGRKTFCEYMESEFVIKYGPLFLKAFAELHSYSAVKV